jgi:hypothetical protein
MTTSDDNIKWFHQHVSSTYNLLETAVPMVDVAMYAIKHIKRLCTSSVSHKVKSDLFREVVNYSQAKGNLIAFFIEPITARLLKLSYDEEFDQANFMRYHLSMPMLSHDNHLPRQNLLSKTIR